MKKSICVEKRDDFVSLFMSAYQSAGIRVPVIRMAYGKPFEIVEYHRAYKVTANGVTRRYSNLFQVAEFVFDQNYDIMHIYTKPKTEKELAERASKKKNVLHTIRTYLHNIFKPADFVEAA